MCNQNVREAIKPQWFYSLTFKVCMAIFEFGAIACLLYPSSLHQNYLPWLTQVKRVKTWYHHFAWIIYIVQNIIQNLEHILCIQWHRSTYIDWGLLVNPTQVDPTKTDIQQSSFSSYHNWPSSTRNYFTHPGAYKTCFLKNLFISVSTIQYKSSPTLEKPDKNRVLFTYG